MRLLLAFAIAVCTHQASACDGAGLGYGWLYNSLHYQVPYFAAHPPVYYSYPVPRTYGHSPFAYPPHFRTPDAMESVQPLEIVNPYVPSSSSAPAPESGDVPSRGRTVSTSPEPTSAPLVIENPFCADGERLVGVNR